MSLDGTKLKEFCAHLRSYDLSNKFLPTVLHRHCYTSLQKHPPSKAPMRNFSKVIQQVRAHVEMTLESPRASRSSTSKASAEECSCSLCDMAFPKQRQTLFSSSNQPGRRLSLCGIRPLPSTRSPLVPQDVFKTPTRSPNASLVRKRALSLPDTHSTDAHTQVSEPPTPTSQKKTKRENFAISIEDWLKLQDSLDLPTREAIKLQRELRKLLKDVVEGSSKDRLFESAIHELFDFPKLGLKHLTPKLHVLLEHAPVWCNKRKCGLGKCSEQSFETSHHDFKLLWDQRFKVSSLEASSYKKRLLHAVLTYASRRVPVTDALSFLEELEGEQDVQNDIENDEIDAEMMRELVEE